MPSFSTAPPAAIVGALLHNHSQPYVLAQEIEDDPQAALAQIQGILGDLQARVKA